MHVQMSAHWSMVPVEHTIHLQTELDYLVLIEYVRFPQLKKY